MVFVALCPGTPEGSTRSGSGFKHLRRRGNDLKSHLTDREKLGIEPATHSVFVAVFLGHTSTGWEGLCFLLFYVQELLKAQPAVVLVLKGLRRRGNGLKSHQTDWEKLGIHNSSTTWNIFIKFCLLII